MHVRILRTQQANKAKEDVPIYKRYAEKTIKRKVRVFYCYE